MATEWYRRAAERGHADAQYNLGFMYLLGEGVQANPNEGLRWLRLSADQGDESAIRLIADLYRDGMYGVSADPAEEPLWQERYRMTDLSQTCHRQLWPNVALLSKQHPQKGQLSGCPNRGTLAS